MKLPYNIESIAQAAEDFLSLLKSDKTARAYRTALNHFYKFLEQSFEIACDFPPQAIATDMLSSFIDYLKAYRDDRNRALSKLSQRHYINAVKQFMNHLVYRELAPEINTARLDLIVQKEAPEPPARKKINVDIEAIHIVLEYARQLHLADTSRARFPERKHLEYYRDRALLLTLASTGARINEEALQLTMGDIDWKRRRAEVVGKGNTIGELRFSREAIQALRDYLEERAPLDGASGRPLESLPLFARHDVRAGTDVKPLGYGGAWLSLKQHFGRALAGYENRHLLHMTPHQLRHFFVTNLVLTTDGDITIARELARHADISTTTRYLHVQDADLEEAHERAFDLK